MAYNILKGTVEGSVDQHADQEINGVKVFKSTISASVFYDTDAQSPCATLKDVAIKKIKGGSQNSLLICDTEHGAKTAHNLSYQNDTLHAERISSKEFEGSAHLLVEIPCNRFIDKIAANFIRYGNGIDNVRGNLQVKVGDGLTCNDDGIEVNLASNSALSTKGKKLKLDLTKTEAVNTAGQNLSDGDLLVVNDVSLGDTRHTTLANLYTNYVADKVPHAAGVPGHVQFKGKNEFESSPNLQYEPLTSTLNVDGKTKSNIVVSKNKLVCEGSVYHNIIKISDTLYNVANDDYTILCDSSKNKITVKLPPAQNNCGRVIVIKKTNSKKYKINSHIVEITCDEGTIDINKHTEIKMNYSSRTVQSDGENWWIIGTKGT